MAKQELLVAAVKKEVVADYQEILRACGTEPVFTLAALARRNLCAESAADFSMLDIGGSQSELTVFEKGVPTNSRIIFWGHENAASLTDARLDTLAQIIKGSLTGAKLFISGDGISEDFTARLTQIIGRRLAMRTAGSSRPEDPPRFPVSKNLEGRAVSRRCSSGSNNRAARPRVWRRWI